MGGTVRVCVRACVCARACMCTCMRAYVRVQVGWDGEGKGDWVCQQTAADSQALLLLLLL